MKQIWGELTQIGENKWRLAAPKDTPDGIGSALAIGPRLSEKPVRVIWQIDERWGGEEGWRGLWLYFPYWQEQVHPAFYIRVGSAQIEWGWSRGSKPRDQVIGGTINSYADIKEGVWLSSEGYVISISAGVDCSFRWYLPFDRTAAAYPPRLGIYCEASVVTFEIEDGCQSGKIIHYPPKAGELAWRK